MNQRKLEKSKQIFFIYLGIDILFNAILGFNTFSTIETLREIESGARNFNQLLSDSLSLWGNVSFIIIIILIGVGIALVSWLNSCYSFAKNSLGLTGFKNEKWTITGWIIPIYNLLKPYHIFSELYQAGSPDYREPADWKKEKAPGWLLAWWFFWIVTHLILGIIVKELFQKYYHDKFVLEKAIFYEIQIWFYVISTLIAITWFFVAQILTERLINRLIKAPDENLNKNIISNQILVNKADDKNKNSTSLCDSYFDDSKNDDPLLTDDPLEKDWIVALKYYKDLPHLESRLSKISTRLFYQFRKHILQEKAFDDRQKIADAMERDFFKTCFGENQKIIDFARYLIEIDNKSAAKSLSEAVRVIGNKIDLEKIIEQIKNEFTNSFRKRLEVIAVNEKSEARTLGIQEGDVLYTYNNIPLESNEILTSTMDQYQGQQHLLKVIREQKLFEFYITAGPLDILTKQTSDEF